jgi:hypothetical protein
MEEVAEVKSEVAVADGIKVANEAGNVVCPEVNTAHAPARTTPSTPHLQRTYMKLPDSVHPYYN